MIVEAAKRRLAGHHLVHHDPEREDVAASVDHFAARLLGRHVGRRPDHRAHHRQGAGVGRLLIGGAHRVQLRNPEVEDLGNPPLGQHDIGRLQITVDDAGRVRRSQRIGDLPRGTDRLFRWQRSFEQPRCRLCPSSSSITIACTSSTWRTS